MKEKLNIWICVFNTLDIMKKILLLFLPFLLVGCKEEQQEQVAEQPTSTAIYICNSPTAETYHNNPECRGLSRCRYEVVEVTQEEAEELGRRPCKFCY